MDLAFFLKTVKNCNNNTALKYISNFKKIVTRAIDKEIIFKDPFKSFKGKKDKTTNTALSNTELAILENYKFSTERLSQVRFVLVSVVYRLNNYLKRILSEDIKLNFKRIIRSLKIKKFHAGTFFKILQK